MKPASIIVSVPKAYHNLLLCAVDPHCCAKIIKHIREQQCCTG